MGCCYPLSKCMILLTWVILIFNLVFFAILLVAGIASQNERAKTEWASATSTCATSAQSLSTQLASTQATLSQLQAAGGSTTQVVQAQADVVAAQAQVAIFSNMCTCITDLLGKLEPLTGPGVFGVISVIFAIITVDSLCCAMGCCCKRPTIGVVKPAA